MRMVQDIPGFKTNVPLGAFYLFPDVSYYFGKKHHNKTIDNATDLCMYLLMDANVALVTGSAFGMPNCARLSYATSEYKLKEAMKRIKEALAKLE